MIPNVPHYISILFVLTTFATLYLFIKAMQKSYPKKVFFVVIVSLFWLVLQTILAVNNVYNTHTDVLPPKIFIFGILPILVWMLYLFYSKKGKVFIDNLPQQNLVLISVVRIPVEIILYLLFVYKTIPEIMTFEGRNFDILAGITALFVYYFGFIKKNISKKVVFIWHFISLGLLLNIIIHAILSTPTPFQQFGFSQPNIAILHFPFCWLPTFIVPVVLFSHLICIKQLMQTK
jgi:hypothetical protein